MVRSLDADRFVSVIRNLVASIGVALLFSLAAFDRGNAASNLELTVLDWVESINASSNWAAEIQGLSVDDTRDVVTVERLLVAAKVGGVVVEIEGATLSGFAIARSGGFTAESFQIAYAEFKTLGVDVVMRDISFDDVGVPVLPAATYDSSKPFTSLISAFSALAKTSAAAGRIAEIEVLERFDDEIGRVSYENVAIDSVVDGEIDRIQAGPLKMASPASDPIAGLTAANAEARSVDLDTFVHVYDPLRYIAGIGDGAWRRAIAEITYTDISLVLPNMRLELGSIAIEDFDLRQPRESFSALIDAKMARREISKRLSDALTTRDMPGLLSAHRVGRFAINQIELAATGIDQLTLETLTFTEASNDSFGEIVMEEFIGAIAGQGAIGIGRITLGDVVMPSFNLFERALERAERGADIDFSSLVPKLGLVEAIGINVQAIDFPGVLLGRMRADLSNYLGNTPTEIAVEIDDLDIATSSLRPNPLRNLVASLGYDRLRTNARFDLFWREADETVRLDNLRVGIKDFANTTVNMVLGGIPRQAIETPDELSKLAPDLNFEHASVVFEDKSVVDRGLSMRAELLNIPLDRLRQQLAGALPLMLAFVGNPEMVKEIVPVLQDFIKSPGTLTIEAGPDQPVPVSTVAAAIRSRPQSLPGMLGIRITGMPGP